VSSNKNTYAFITYVYVLHILLSYIALLLVFSWAIYVLIKKILKLTEHKKLMEDEKFYVGGLKGRRRH
jgi:EamA domain-containing membrane protein RarD